MRQRSRSTHSIAVPLSQLRPGPSPRRKRALPKPTSIRALIVVTTALLDALTTGFTAGATARAGLGASIATGVGVSTRIVAAVAGFFAMVFDAADLVAG